MNVVADAKLKPAYEESRVPFAGNVIAVDESGTFAAVAGLAGVALVSLQNPHHSPQILKFPTVCEEEPRAIDWNHSSQSSFLCAVPMNSDVFLWNVESSPPSANLRRHHRGTVTDLNWNYINTNILLTCSTDKTIGICDIRSEDDGIFIATNEYPLFAKWNKFNEHDFATAHKGDVYIWDKRRPNAHVKMIKAHSGAIQSLDWSATHPKDIVTCGTDSCLKFWDVDSRLQFKGKVSTYPAFRLGKFAPFGEYVVSIAKEGDYSMSVWLPPLEDSVDVSGNSMFSNIESSIPLYTFTGSSSSIVDFCWRHSGSSTRDLQIVSWSRDSRLCLWNVDQSISQVIIEQALNKTTKLPNKSAPVTLVHEHLRMNRSHSGSLYETPKSLAQELRNIDRYKPNIKVEKISPCGNQITVSIVNPMYDKKLRFFVVFPSKYPNKEIPTCDILEGTTLDSAQIKKLKQVFQQTAHQLTSQSFPCFEACLRVMVSTMNAYLTESESISPIISPIAKSVLDVESDVGFSRDAPVAPTKPAPQISHIAQIPPRTSSVQINAVMEVKDMGGPKCGIRFGPNNKILIFGNGIVVGGSKQINVSRLRLYSVSETMNPSANSMAINRPLVEKEPVFKVHIYTHKDYLRDVKILAADYRLKGDIDNIIQHNSKIANENGRKDLAQMWNMVQHITNIARQRDPFDIKPNSSPAMSSYSTSHPLVRPMIKKMHVYSYLMDHLRFESKFDLLEVCKDVQSISILFVLFTSLDIHLLSAKEVNMESNSQHTQISRLSASVMTRQTASKNSILPYPPEHFASVVKYYAELLYWWGQHSPKIMNHRLEILKVFNQSSSDPVGIGFQMICERCHRPCRAPSCIYCRRYAFSCSICHNPVKGISHFCLVCGHGGHANHIQAWFSVQKSCPSGCGCRCAELSGC